MDNTNLNIWKNELISTLILIGVLISLVVTLTLSSSSLLEAWQTTFNHAHDMEITIGEIRNLLIVSTIYFLIVLGPIFMVGFFGGLGSFKLGLKKVNHIYRPITKSVFLILETTLIILIFFSYIYFNFDHILSVRNLPIDKIFSFIWKMIVEIISLILIFKIFIISSRLFRSESKSH